ncbi:MAG: type II secretion system protein [Caldiserica bacterium]|nr:type II secretion system protein [Caldisericota bacterium]
MRRGVRYGFTLIELLVVMAIIVTLAGILTPALLRAREQGRRVVCVNNLRQIGLAMRLYAEDFDGYYPYSLQEYTQLYNLKYINTPRTFWCPSDYDSPPNNITTSNIENSYQLRDNQVASRVKDSLIPGLGGSSTIRIGWDLTPVGRRNHGKDGGNILFMDGSVRWYRFGNAGDYEGVIR